MSEYKSAAESAKVIRVALKAKGWGPRHVSVTCDNYSMGSSVHVRIKDASVPLAVVSRIATAEQSIHRDGNGEILGGSNRYVDVTYDWELEKAARAVLLPILVAMAHDGYATIGKRYQVKRVCRGGSWDYFEAVDIVEGRVVVRHGTTMSPAELCSHIFQTEASAGRWKAGT